MSDQPVNDETRDKGPGTAGRNGGPERLVLFYFHLAQEFPEEIERVASFFPDVTMHVATGRDEFEGLLPRAEVIVAAPQRATVLDRSLASADTVPSDDAPRPSHFRAHIIPFAGVNRVPLSWYAQHDVLVASSHGNADTVAERAVALMYAAAGRIVEFDQDLRQGSWHRREDKVRPFDYWRGLSGSRVAVLGTGAIGCRIGRLIQPLVGSNNLAGWGGSGSESGTTSSSSAPSGAPTGSVSSHGPSFATMRGSASGEIVGFRRGRSSASSASSTGSSGASSGPRIVTAEAPGTGSPDVRRPERVFSRLTTTIEDAVSGADVVFVTLPLTEETRNMVTHDLLQATNRAVLVNVSRAEIIPEDDLYRALTDQTLYAAGLDVWYRYPDPPWQVGIDAMPASRPFHQLPNVVLSPHAGSHTQEGKRAQLTGALAHLEEYLKTDALTHAVDTSRGY